MYPIAVIEVAIGLVDGANLLFDVSADYVPGSPIVFLNGVAKRKDFDDGWIELGGKKLQLKQAPKLGDVVSVYFRPL